jgi:hypothetical protein
VTILNSLEREHLFRFLQYHAYLDEGHGCWLWKLAKFGHGYGYFYFLGQVNYVHRLSYAVFIGDFDDTLHVLHKCDVKHCYYPDHLFLGTNADNVADKVAKGRQAKLAGERNPMFGKIGEKAPMFCKGHLIAGEKNASAKLREDQVLEILAKREEGLLIREIAKQYGVCNASIRDILRGKNWKHVQRSVL